MCQENEAEGGEIIRKVNDPSFSAIDCISYFYRFWTFFIRQKMALLFLKRRTAPHLRRERKNISVPSTWMLLDFPYRKCVFDGDRSLSSRIQYLARCTKQR